MKNTQRIISRRNIRSQKVSYISVIVIAMLAVSAFLGINYSADALKDNASDYMKKLNFRDIDITSTMLLTSEDIDEIKNTDGVTDAEGVYQTTATLFGEDENMTVDVLSLTERISLPEMLEGRLPENFYECAAEKEIMENMGLSVGDSVTLGTVNGDCAPYLRHKVFRITGTFLHADHYSKEVFSGGNRYILVTVNSFDTKELDDCYMRAAVKLDVPADVRLISKEYDRLEREASDRLELLAETRAPLRDEQVKEKYQKEIDKNDNKLKEAKKELDSARIQLDQNAKKIADGEKELESSWNKLEDARKQLAAAKKQLDEAKSELDANKPKLDVAQKELDSAANELSDGWRTIESKKEEIRQRIKSTVDGTLPAGVSVSWAQPSYPSMDSSSLDADVFRITTNVSVNVSDAAAIAAQASTAADNLKNEIRNKAYYALEGTSKPGSDPEDPEVYTTEDIDELLAPVMDAIDSVVTAANLQDIRNAAEDLGRWNDGHEAYLSSREQFLAAKEKYDNGLAAYQAGLSEYQSSYGKYERGLEKYKNGLAELEDAKKQLAEGEEKYAEGMAEYEDGAAKFQEAKDIVAGLHPCRWIVLDAACNPSYIHAKASAENIAKVSMTFSMLFVLLGILIIYTTIARIVGEQKKYVGTEKALGFFNSEAAVKYLIFGISGTILGTVLGTAVSYFIIQAVVLFAHKSFYVTDTIPSVFNGNLTLVAFALGIVISALAVWFACSELIKKPAVELMKDEMPVVNVKNKTKKAKANTKGSSLYSKLIFRNIRTDIRRVAITVISVAGCCILLVVGFSVKDGIVNAVNSQYRDILTFNQRVTYDPSASETVEQDAQDILDKNGVQYTKLYCRNQSFRSGNELNSGDLICGDKDDIAMVMNMTEPRTGKPVVPGDHGVCIARRTSVYYGVGAGDKITLYNSAMEPVEATIEGVFENYTGMFLVMTKEAYREVFGEDPVENSYYIRNNTDSKEINEQLLGTTGVLGIKDNDTEWEEALSASNALTLITVVLIVAAGIMAYFILLNLASMYINQKKRELTVMRINGFTTREAIAYVSREAVVTTLMGIIVGIAFGTGFSYIILRSIEHRNAGFMLLPDYNAWLFSALITIVYSVVIYAIALRKVKDLKLTDIA